MKSKKTVEHMLRLVKADEISNPKNEAEELYNLQVKSKIGVLEWVLGG